MFTIDDDPMNTSNNQLPDDQFFNFNDAFHSTSASSHSEVKSQHLSAHEILAKYNLPDIMTHDISDIPHHLLPSPLRTNENSLNLRKSGNVSGYPQIMVQNSNQSLDDSVLMVTPVINKGRKRSRSSSPPRDNQYRMFSNNVQFSNVMNEEKSEIQFNFGDVGQDRNMKQSAKVKGIRDIKFSYNPSLNVSEKYQPIDNYGKSRNSKMEMVMDAQQRMNIVSGNNNEWENRFIPTPLKQNMKAFTETKKNNK